MGAFVAATGESLVVVSCPLRDASISYGLLLGNFVRLVARSLANTLALRRVQFPHQLTDADTGPEVNLPDPALHVLVVALSGIGDQRGSFVPNIGRVVDAGALGQSHTCCVVADQGGAGVHQPTCRSVEALIA